jgi:hypothetical protein
VRRESSFDLRPYALERFEAGAVFPETIVLRSRPGERRKERDHREVAEEQ